VKLTWEDDDADRALVTRRTLSNQELESTDFRVYLASSEFESDPDESDIESRQRLRELLLGNADAHAEVWDNKVTRQREMEVTFIPGVTTALDDKLEREEENTIERYTRKRREKRHQQKSNIGFTKKKGSDKEGYSVVDDHLADITGKEDIKHFDLTAILKHEKLTSSTRRHGRKRKVDIMTKETQDDFVMNAVDERFTAIHMDHQFAIDPSSSR
jgi:NUC153 domain